MLSDYLGSITLVVDQAGNELGRTVYTPYGTLVTSTLALTVTKRLFGI